MEKRADETSAYPVFFKIVWRISKKVIFLCPT